MPLADDVDLDALAKRSDGMSGADIASFCQRAALNEIRSLIAKDKQAGVSTNGTHGKGSGLRIAMRTLEEALEEQRHAVAARSSRNGSNEGGRVPSAAPAARPV
jgi:SpoVK/Ycf46/Vps4 family AAA+-type ATPase